MSLPRILVHEFVTGGGWTEPALPPGLAAEALAMLHAALADFRAWGAVRTITTLDPRLTGRVDLPADEVIPLPPARYPNGLTELAFRCDVALLVAPESDGILAQLTALVTQTGTGLLGSTAAAIAIAGDKGECHRRFRQARLPTPDTWPVNVAEAPAAARVVGWPLVVKPVDGIGSEGVRLVADEAELAAVLALPPYRHAGKALLQRYVSGIPASVSLLVSESDTLPLSLNEQFIGPDFAYQGGRVPLAHPHQPAAFELARQAVALIPGLRGYVGVDVILTEHGCQLIEINPRLTSSYIGLRQVININLAEAIFNACYYDALPEIVTLTGPVTFRKADWPDPARLEASA